MTVDTCPSDAELKAHLLGELTGDNAEAVDKLLASCNSCVKREEGSCIVRAEDLSFEDPLLSALGVGPVEIDRDAEVVSKIIEKASTLNIQLDSTNANPKADDQSISDVDLSFLNPSQDEDELGRLGPFRILNVLGVGGMGVVLKAEDSNLSREVALKVMKPEIAAGAVAKQRFLREARATAAIEHDNIVTIYQVDEDGGVPYLAMPLLEGESLRDHVNREKKLPVRDILKIAKEVASGLAAAHAAGLIHRDIKPDNIWLEDRSSADQSTSAGTYNKYRVKIVDFGLARADDDINITQSGAIVGTPRYMSPEQANGKVADHRTDLFSLGGVLYHLATGLGPFDRKSLPATLFAVMNDDAIPVAELRPDLPEELSHLIDRLLKKKPTDRPQSADEVVNFINKYLKDRVTKSTLQTAPRKKPGKSTSNTGLPRKPVRKKRGFNPLLIGLAMLVLIVPVWGIVLLFDTPEGTLRVEVTGDDIEVLVDNETIKLNSGVGEATKKLNPLKLKLKIAGVEIPFDPKSQQFLLDEGKIAVTLGKTELRSNSFDIAKNKTTVLRIDLIPVTNLTRNPKTTESKHGDFVSALKAMDVTHHFPFDHDLHDVVGRVQANKIGDIQINRNSIAGDGCLRGPSGENRDRLEIDGVANAFAQEEFSISLWARFDKPFKYPAPRLIEALAKTEAKKDVGVFGVAFQVDAPKMYSSSQNGAVVGEKFVADRWYHIAVTRDRQFSKLYVNGTLVGSSAIIGAVAKPHKVIVAGADWTTRGWDGLIDELTIFHISLSPNDVASLANNPRLISNLVARQHQHP